MCPSSNSSSSSSSKKQREIGSPYIFPFFFSVRGDIDTKKTRRFFSNEKKAPKKVHAQKRTFARGLALFGEEEELPGDPRPALFLFSSSSSSFGFSFPTKEENAGSERARFFCFDRERFYYLLLDMSKKRRRREEVEGPPPEQGNGESDKNELWKIVTDHPDIFDTHIVTKLNGNDVKFFYDVNSESRRAIKRSGVQLRKAFKIGDFDTTSTISWALEKCSEKKERFCA